MSENMELRMPEHSDAPCQLCNRRFLKAEAHWFCSFCRKHDERAKCLENCPACVAMEEEEWRKKAYIEAEYKKAAYHRSKNRNRSGTSPSSFIFSGKRKGGKAKSSPSKKKPLFKRVIVKSTKPKPPPPPPPPSVSSSPRVTSAYDLRLGNFECFLFNELNPVIPPNLVEKGFSMPKIPPSLKNKYDVARWELIRLLATSSMCYHLSKNRTQFCDEDNQIFNANSDGLVSLFASLIKFKANTLGKAIFEIRATLLKNVVCNSPHIVEQMIKGPIKPRESFFGNLDVLKEAVAADKQNVLRISTQPEPSPIKEENRSADEQDEDFDISNESTDFSDF